MSGLDMRKIMENLDTETPKKKVKLDESLGGTPIANDIMELAAKLEAIQVAADAEELAEAKEAEEVDEDEVDETEDDEAEDDDDEDDDDKVDEAVMLTKQLVELVEMANRRGMTDAAKWLKEQIAN